MAKLAKCKNCKHSCYLLDEYFDPYFWCNAFEDNFDENREVFCTSYKPKTNAEMLRSMTDVQLASFLISFSYGDSKISYDKILAWLGTEIKGA